MSSEFSCLGNHRIHYHQYLQEQKSSDGQDLSLKRNFKENKLRCMVLFDLSPFMASKADFGSKRILVMCIVLSKVMCLRSMHNMQQRNVFSLVRSRYFQYSCGNVFRNCCFMYYLCFKQMINTKKSNNSNSNSNNNNNSNKY